MEKIREFLAEAKEKWLRYEEKAVLWLSVALVGCAAFQAGLIHGRSVQAEPVVIEKPAAPAAAVAGATSEKSGEEGGRARPAQKAQDGQSKPPEGNCRFVGSRNSDKYHDPSCPVVKRIKPENRVCFASEEDARAKGYKVGCLGKGK
jgi:hypothetical protein